MSSKDILLVTLNSTYQHAAFGLRYLYENLEELQPQAQILEFTINQDVRVIAEKILTSKPRIVGLGVYIWNARQSLDLVMLIKKISPQTLVVIGGPEVSHEIESQDIVRKADYVIKGEADFLWRDFCRQILSGVRPDGKIIKGALPDISQIHLPYQQYTDEDIRNRVIYVEASRGCPYKCEYCLSSLDTAVRNFPLQNFLNQMDHLISRGVRQFKFVDRTFNLSPKISSEILQFFLSKVHLGLFLHFEMVPDRLPEELKSLISQFPTGSLQFEVGIQTWNTEVARNVSRRQDYKKIAENFRFLRSSSHVHTHADLIVGLPGESLESFGRGFDQLASCEPDEIQVGILKRLKGTPIVRHDQEFQMIYQDHPPYQILATKDMSYQEVQKMVRFAKFWDLYANSGEFLGLIKHFKSETATHSRSFFQTFMKFSDFLSNRHPEGHGIALLRLVESAWRYLISESMPAEQAKELLLNDYLRTQRRDIPNFFKTESIGSRSKKERTTPERQIKHLNESLNAGQKT